MPVVRGHNDGSIFHRRADQHQVATVTMPNGKRPTLSCPHRHRPSDRDCQEARDNLAELLRLRDHRAPPGGHTLTLGQYLRRWLDDVRPNLAPATWRKHESIVRTHLTPSLGSTRLSELSVAEVRMFVVRGGGSPQTRRHHRATLRRALADALREGLIQRNVAALAEPPRMTTTERQILDAGQVRTLIDGTRDDRLHALWVLAATTGMRLAEMLALTWEDVTDDRVTVRSTLHRIDGQWQRRGTKTDKSRRTIPLPEVTALALREHRRRQLEERAASGALGADGLVFTTERGRPIHGSNLPRVLHEHTDRLGLPRVTIHSLRHSCATLLISEGYPIAKVAAILGHSSSRVTEMVYSHLVGKDLEDAAPIMERAYGGLG